MTSLATNKLRVLFYIGSLHAGGAERQVLELVRQLDRNRFEPALALANRQGELLPEVPADVPIHAYQVPGESSRGPQRFGLGRWGRCRWLARLLAQERIDVIYDRTYLAALDAAVACWFRPTPRLAAAVADPAVQFAMYARWPKPLWRRYSRWSYHSADLVLANSAGLRDQLIDFWQLPPDRVRLQPNALDFERIDRMSALPAEVATTARPGLSEGPDSRREPASPKLETLSTETARVPPRGFCILTVGRIDHDKGHADLLAAIDDLVHQRGMIDLIWQIIGTGPNAAALEADVARRGLTTVVQFFGVQANPFPFYRAADLFVLPSRSEGLPNVLLEALALGTPVVSTDCVSGPREILQGGRYGWLVPVQDSAALADAIMACRADPEAARAQARLGQAAVRDSFDSRKVVRQLEERLTECVR